MTARALLRSVARACFYTANTIRYCGAAPVFVDIDPMTKNMDPTRVEAAITPKTRAIMCVHQVGMPCDMVALVDIARRHKLPLIEDAACAIGSEILWNGAWERIGRPHGDIACFSFHPRKVMSTGDGGMLTTNNPEHDACFRLLRQHGMSVNDRVRHGSNQVIFEEHSVIGFNYRMTDIQAAVGRQQLLRMPRIIEQRRGFADSYRRRLSAISDVTLPFEPASARSNWQSFIVQLPDESDQRLVMQAMLDRGVATRRGIMCAHRELPYRRPEGFDLPISEFAQDRFIILPLYPEMTEDDVQYVCTALQESVELPN